MLCTSILATIGQYEISLLHMYTPKQKPTARNAQEIHMNTHKNNPRLSIDAQTFMLLHSLEVAYERSANEIVR